MSLTVKIGATLTGGSDVVLSSAGLSAGGKVSFVTPDSTRLTPEQVDIFVTGPTANKNDPGVARTGFKIAFASRVTDEGCCTPSAGVVIFDGSIRWPLSQPETVVDDVIAMIRGLVYTTAFADACKKGILPS
jgi:hypothetical protein